MKITICSRAFESMKAGAASLTAFALSLTLLLSAATLRASDPETEGNRDAAITSQIKAALLFHLVLKTRTETINGVVILTGEAEDAAEKALSTKLATGTAGVKSVRNEMVVTTLAIAANH